MTIMTKRIYESREEREGFRVLVDRLWPRGLRKDEVHVDIWLKEVGPTSELRNWFGHDPARWAEFKKRYFKELAHKKDIVDQLIAAAKGKTLVLLYGAKDKEHNQALALKEYLEAALKKA